MFVDSFPQFALRCSSLARTELSEIEIVVEGLAGIVEDTAFALLYDGIQVCVFKFRADDELIEVVKIGLQVLTVVELHCFFADNRSQCIDRIRQGNEFVSHNV